MDEIKQSFSYCISGWRENMVSKENETDLQTRRMQNFEGLFGFL